MLEAEESMHSSTIVNKEVEKYISDRCKYYYLPLFSDSFFPQKIQDLLGSANSKNRSDVEIQSSIIKAQHACCSHIKVPLDRQSDPSIESVIEKTLASQLGIVLQVCVSSLKEKSFYEYLLKLNKSCCMEWVFDDSSELIEERIDELNHYFDDSYISIPVFRELDWSYILRSQSFLKAENIHLYLGYQVSLKGSFLNCKESHKLIGLLRQKFPEKNFLPARGVDIWDFRANHDFDMEPFIHPCYSTQSQQANIKYSVIIPTYNNQNHLRVVLRHLYEQSIGLDAFEVIVVDDGGTDQTQRLVMELLSEFPEPMNFHYIFFPRVRKRVMGDSQYRAGISRNLGVKNSSGEILCFLDSDIVVGQDYLDRVGKSLIHNDAIQAKRINLSQAASHLSCRYDKVDAQQDLIPDEPYWEEFLQTKDWHLLPYNWKYVCTHSFSLKKEVFWKVGGLKRNFIYYGFEDTDLGYRLVKSGHKLHLLDAKVYHLFHENTRSEFMNLSSLRHSLLSRTAQIFYLHHFDEDIYENLLGFMEPEPGFRRLLRRVFKILSLQFLWRPKDKVYRSLKLRS